VPTLMRRELISYFRAPLAYILAAAFSGIVLLFSWRGLEAGPKNLLPGIVRFSSFLMIFLVPILTMRLLAQERDTGAMEVLVTDPVTDWDIVLGKYLASVLTLWAMLLPMGVYVVIYALIGWGQNAADVPWYKFWSWLPAAMEWGPVLTSFLGLALIGALFAAVGLFASSLTRNQAISALIGFMLILVLWAFVLLEQFFDGTKAQEIIQSLSLFNRMDILVDGRLDTRSLWLFLSTTVLMLYLTVRAVESRKWR
jgi:ABC-2 type transport system permease protein